MPVFDYHRRLSQNPQSPNDLFDLRGFMDYLLLGRTLVGGNLQESRYAYLNRFLLDFLAFKGYSFSLVRNAKVRLKLPTISEVLT